MKAIKLLSILLFTLLIAALVSISCGALPTDGDDQFDPGAIPSWIQGKYKNIDAISTRVHEWTFNSDDVNYKYIESITSGGVTRDGGSTYLFLKATEKEGNGIFKITASDNSFIFENRGGDNREGVYTFTKQEDNNLQYTVTLKNSDPESAVVLVKQP